MVLTVAGFIALVKAAVTRVFMATPVTTGFWAAGAVALTRGARPTLPPRPKIGAWLPPQPTTNRVAVMARSQAVNLASDLELGMEGRVYRLLRGCSEVSEG